jgi:alkaline phosphatase
VRRVQVTHATPACVYGHSADRNFESTVLDDDVSREVIEHYIDQGFNDACHQRDIATQARCTPA